MANTTSAIRKPLAQLYTLWDRLGDVPITLDIDNVEVLDAPFLHFAIGAPREDVWHWFEAQHPDFIVGDVMQGRRKADAQPVG